MVDRISGPRRSENMRRIRSSDTKPEMTVRRLLHRLGYRYRLGGASLPGRPDIVFKSRRVAIFVHGCFWHQHVECREGRVPASNAEYWAPKLKNNRARDASSALALRSAGWQVLVVWECETALEAALQYKLTTLLGPPRTGVAAAHRKRPPPRRRA